MVWEVDEYICLAVHKFFVFHLRGYLEEKEISLLVYVWMLVLAFKWMKLNISLWIVVGRFIIFS